MIYGTLSAKCTFLVPAGEPTATYTITFQGVTVQNNNSTWCYSVSVTGAPGLSHWVLGVLFEVGIEAEESPVQYCITLEGVYKIEEYWSGFSFCAYISFQLALLPAPVRPEKCLSRIKIK